MIELLLDYATVIAYIAFNTDIALQIKKIYSRKSSKDISIKGAAIRMFAGWLLLIKIISTSERYLTIGQSIFVALYIVYFIMLIHYREKLDKRLKKTAEFCQNCYNKCKVILKSRRT